MSSRREKTTICKLDWTAAADGGLFLIKGMDLIAAYRAPRMNEFFLQQLVTIATSRVEAEPADLMRNVALTHKMAAHSTKTAAVFFDRPLSR
ncbi:hypothetical protein X771_11420 [Mesorhizobium sp. LSJC277A00]|nr:hypothetical protein X771_11420 [Mesorhizobium sp. LSJC277A00]